MSAVQILPQLWLGNIKARFDQEFLREHKISCVINAASDHIVRKYASEPEHIRCPGVSHYYDLDLPDRGDAHSVAVIRSRLNEASALIRRHLLRGDRVLVHCYAGKHRSPLLVIAFLAEAAYLDYPTTHQIVKLAWPHLSTFYHRALTSSS